MSKTTKSSKKPDLDDEKFHGKSLKSGKVSPLITRKDEVYTHSTKPQPLSTLSDTLYKVPDIQQNYGDRAKTPALFAVKQRFLRTSQGARSNEMPRATVEEFQGRSSYNRGDVTIDNIDDLFEPVDSTDFNSTNTNRAPTSLGGTRTIHPGISRPATSAVVSDHSNGVQSEMKADSGYPILDSSDDPVTFFAQHKQGPVKFVYLNQVKNENYHNPYQLQMVPFNEIDKDYYTMSSNGITFVRSDGQSEFTPMSQWVREADVFEIVSRLDVFRTYRQWKTFRKWRSYISKRRLKSNRLLLETSLFSVKPIFAKYLLQLMKNCELNLLKTDLLPVRAHSNYSVTEFNNSFGNGPNSHKRAAKQKLVEFIDEVSELIERMCSEVGDPERVRISSDEFKMKARRKVSLRQLMLIEKQKALERAKVTGQVNSEITLIGNFIRFSDYFILEYLIKLLLSEMSLFLGTLQVEKATIFTTSVMFDDNAVLQFTPNVTTVLNLVNEVVKDTITLLNSVPRVLYHPTLEKYVEASGQKPPNTSEGPSFNQFLFGVEQFHNLQLTIKEVIENSFNSANTYAKHFNEFRTIFLFGNEWDVEKYRISNPTLEQFSQDLAKFTKWASDMDRIQTSSTRGILFIDSKALKAALLPIPSRAVEDLKLLLAQIASEKTITLLDLFRNSINTLSVEPSTLEECVEFVRFYNPLADRINQFNDDIQLIDEMYTLLDEYKAPITALELERHSLIHTVFSSFKERLSQAQQLKKRIVPNSLKTLEKNIADSAILLQVIDQRLSNSVFSDPRSIPQSLLIDLNDIKSQAKLLKEKVDKYTEYQVVLESSVSETAIALANTIKHLEQTENLWQAVSKLQQLEEVYNNTPFNQLQRAEIERDLETIFVTVSTMLDINSENAVARNMMDKIELYRKIMPHILVLANPAIKARHWTRLFEAVEQNYEQDAVFTLAQLKEYKILDHENLIDEISSIAIGEFSLENTLELIEQFWEQAQFTLVPYHNKAKNIVILAVTEEIQRTLDDNALTLVTMLGSEHIGGIRKKVESLRSRISQMSVILDEWVICQERWARLEPILSQYEVQRQLAAQYTKFKIVDRKWRGIMRTTQKDSKVINATSQHGLLATLRESNDEMEMILHSLESYVDQKRLHCPRFFFISSDEIFEMMSRIHDPRAIQPFLSKCFDKVRMLQFDAETDQVLAMVNENKERLIFNKPISTEGTVENLVLNIEDSMQKALQASMSKAIVDYNRAPFEQWIIDFPIQIVLAVMQINWTRKIQSSLEKETPKEHLMQYESVLVKRIESMTNLIRRFDSDDSSHNTQHRSVISSLVMLDLYGLEVTRSLIRHKVSTPFDFEWTKRLRFYWDDKKHRCYIKQTNGTLFYGNEFVSSAPLVITPSIEKYRLSIGEALQNNVGSFLHGDSSVGKTEIIRDMSKAIGRLCLQFNCYSDFNLKTIGNLLSGLVQTGAWGIFEGLLNVEPRTLSVLTENFRTISNAIAEHAENFIFEGKTLRIDDNHAVFITTNSSLPKEICNQELPNHLRQFFRPVAIATPDLETITEVMLLSQGFTETKTLSRKLLSVLATLSDQHSTAVSIEKTQEGEIHGEFGLRFVRTVIQAASEHKQREPQTDITIFLSQAVMECCSARLNGDQINSLSESLRYAFPEYSTHISNSRSLQSISSSNSMSSSSIQKEVIKTDAIRQQLEKLNLEAVPSFMDKIQQFQESLRMYKGIVVVGPTLSGKSTIIQIASQLLPKPPKILVVNSSLVETKEALGSYDNEDVWRDGLIVRWFRKLIQEEKENQIEPEAWLIIDGSLDCTQNASWVHQLHSLLDESRMLSLANGERMNNPKQLRIIFETSTVSKISPLLLSRVGFVSLSAPSGSMGISVEGVSSRHLINSWLKSNQSLLSKKLPENGLNHFKVLFDVYLPTAVEFVQKTQKSSERELENETTITLEGNHLVSNFFHLLESVLIEWNLTKYQDDIFGRMNFVFAFILSWSLGAHLTEHDRVLLSDWVKKNLKNIFSFEEGTIFDYCLDSNGKITTWRKLVDSTFIFDTKSWSTHSPSLIPSVDQLRFAFLLRCLVGNGKNVILNGPRGCGKTSLIKQVISSVANNAIPLTLNYSCHTNALQVHELIDRAHEAKKRNSPSGKKLLLTAFNLNLVDQKSHSESSERKEAWSEQSQESNETSAPSNYELLRQLVTYAGYYDPNKFSFNPLKDFQVLASTETQSNNRDDVNKERFSGRFFWLRMTEPSDETLSSIFQPILKSILLPYSSSDLLRLVPILVDATISLLHLVEKQFKPTSSHLHHHFDVHSILRVFQGMCLSKANSSKSNPSFIIKLWKHEVLRVFSDCLVSENDVNWLKTTFNEIVAQRLQHVNIQSLDPQEHDKENAVIFSEFHNSGYGEYSREQIKILISTVQDQHNQFDQIIPLQSLVDQVAKFCRLFKLGHGIILGPSGSGKRTSVRLAAEMSGSQLSQIKPSNRYKTEDFVADIKKQVLKAGVEDKPVVFLLSEEDFVSFNSKTTCYEVLETILEVINGDSGLLSLEEIEKVVQDVRPSAIEKGVASETNTIFTFFMETVKKNLHFVFSFNSESKAFRDLLIDFPHLLNYFSVNFLDTNNYENLYAVVSSLMKKALEEDFTIHHDSICEVAVQIHLETSRAFESSNAGSFGVSTSQMIDLMNLYVELYKEKKFEQLMRSSNLKAGLKKMQLLTQTVESTRKELQTLKPLLLKVTNDTKRLEESILQHTKVVEDCWQIVHEEQISFNVKNNESTQLLDDARKAQEEFDKVIPHLNGAIAGIRSITKNDMAELGGFLPTPPERIQKILESVCIVKGAQPVVNEMESILNDSLLWMINFNKDNISEDTLNKLKKYTINPEFTPVGTENKAAKFLCAWVIAVYKYANVFKLVQPKRLKVATADSAMKMNKQTLDEKRSQLTAAEERLEQFKQAFKTSNDKKIQLEQKSNDVMILMNRAEKLLESLIGKEVEWTRSLEESESIQENLIGNVLLLAAVVIYLGPCEQTQRKKIISSWMELFTKSSIGELMISDDFSVKKMIDPILLNDWIRLGLHNDVHSIENAFIITRNPRWPCIIDPERQATKWIKGLEKANQFKTFDPRLQNIARSIEVCVASGRPTIVQNNTLDIHKELENIVVLDNFNRRREDAAMVLLSGNEVVYNHSFRLFIITPHANAAEHFSPQFRSKLNVVNFSFSHEGLSEKLLNVVIRTERPDIYQQKDQSIEREMSDTKEKQDLENKVLEVLAETSENSLVNSDEIINEIVAATSNMLSITRRLMSSRDIEQKCDEAREQYRPVALRGAILFRLIKNLTQLSEMYQIGLNQFMNQFKQALVKSGGSSILMNTLAATTSTSTTTTPTPVVTASNLNNSSVNGLPNSSSKSTTRIPILLKEINNAIFFYISPMMTEAHRSLFAFLMAATVYYNGNIPELEWNLLIDIEAVVPDKTRLTKPNEKWVTPKMWANILRFENLIPNFAKSIVDRTSDWKSFIDQNQMSKSMPESFETQLNPLQKIIMLRIITEDRSVLDDVQDFVTKQLGSSFLEPYVVELDRIFVEISPVIPLLFLVEDEGLQISNRICRYALAQSFSPSRFHTVSLGTSNSKAQAEVVIQRAIQEGHWVLLQNCHLCTDWMMFLEKALDPETETIHPNFRLVLTSARTDQFPLSLLQRSLKISNDLPHTIKGSMMTLYRYSATESNFYMSKKPAQFKKLNFGLNFLHSILWSRRKYQKSSLSYPFGLQDHSAFVERMRQYLNLSDERSEEIPFKALQYLASEIFYGGHATDPRENLRIKQLASEFLSPSILDDKFAFTTKEGYLYPTENIPMDSYASRLPVNDPPDVLWFNDLTKGQIQARDVSSMFLEIRKIDVMNLEGVNSSQEENNVNISTIEAILNSVPPALNEELKVTGYQDDLFIINAHNEIKNLNSKRRLIIKTLRLLKEGISNNYALFLELKSAAKSIASNVVPKEWLLSRTTLSLNQWLEELKQKFSYFEKWISGTVTSIWFRAFSNPKALVGAIVQRALRSSKEVDVPLIFEAVLIPSDPSDIPASLIAQAHDEEGIIVQGIVVENARYDPVSNKLEEISANSQLSSQIPLMMLKLSKQTGGKYSNGNWLTCPLYHNTEPGGKNFIVNLKTSNETLDKMWIKRSIVMYTN